jgi:galactokinase
LVVPLSAPAERALAYAIEHGGEVDGVWSAPGRVNLIGEHTDYNDGFVLPMAISQRTAVAVRRRDDRLVRVSSQHSAVTAEINLDSVDSAQLSDWPAYPLGVVWAVWESGFDLSGVSGLDIDIDSDVPIGAGLSSSAAIECAVAVALRDLWNLGSSDADLARLCQRAENVAVGAPTGIMDQSVSLIGKDGHALFLDCRSLEVDHVPFDIEREGLAIVAIDTAVKHANTDGGYASRRASCETVAKALGVPALRDATMDLLDQHRSQLSETDYVRARHIITENQRVLDTVNTLKSRGASAIGEFLSQSHVSMRDDFDISCAELNVAVEASMASGALGSRMTGGGFGGTAIALIGTDRVDALISSVMEAFAQNSFASPRCFVVTAAEGAHRESV